MTNTNTMTRKDIIIAVNAIEGWADAKLGKIATVDLTDLLDMATIRDADTVPVFHAMSHKLNARRAGYADTIAYSGRKSLNNADAVANFLDGMHPADVLATAERILELPEGTLVAKYEHLNVGSIRMNAGNRLRGAMNRGEIEASDLH